MKAFLRRFTTAWADWCNLVVNGSSRRTREILNRSDADAIRSDWEAVGGDLWRAIEEETGKTPPRGRVSP